MFIIFGPIKGSPKIRMLLKKIFHGLKNFKVLLVKDALDREASMVPLGVFGLVSLPLFYFINSYLLPQQAPPSVDYHNIALRIMCGFLCCLLISKNYWPQNARPYLPVVWYSTILLFMPFFATYMTLQSHFSLAWILNTLSIFILTMWLVNWVAYSLLLILGIAFGTLLYCWLTPEPFPWVIDKQPLTLLDVLLTFTVSIIMGVLFNRHKTTVESAKLEGIRMVGSNMAHELRTPLTSIEAGVVGIKNYLPPLLDGYDKAKNAGLPLEFIAPQRYQLLTTVLDRLEKETHYANTIIDMLLLKSKQNGSAFSNFKLYSMDACITEALYRYPFQGTQRDWVKYHPENNFYFYGDSILMVHIFFNLIKNALYFIAKAQKGNIEIWLDSNRKENRVHFKDTAMGIVNTIMPKLFHRFHTYTLQGTGLGLSFCKSTMESFGGDIFCESKYTEFTEFILTFPKPTPEQKIEIPQNP